MHIGGVAVDFGCYVGNVIAMAGDGAYCWFGTGKKKKCKKDYYGRNENFLQFGFDPGAELRILQHSAKHLRESKNDDCHGDGEGE